MSASAVWSAELCVPHVTIPAAARVGPAILSYCIRSRQTQAHARLSCRWRCYEGVRRAECLYTEPLHMPGKLRRKSQLQQWQANT